MKVEANQYPCRRYHYADTDLLPDLHNIVCAKRNMLTCGTTGKSQEKTDPPHSLIVLAGIADFPLQIPEDSIEKRPQNVYIESILEKDKNG